VGDERLVDTVVELADTLVDDFDVIEFLHLLVDRCVNVLDVDAASLLLADPQGRLQVVISSNEQVRLLELFQVQIDQGPCLEAFATGTTVSHADLSTANLRWPRFTPAALDGGFAAVDALPMRLRGEVIGALNLFRIQAGGLDDAGLRAARALTDVAAIGVSQGRSSGHQEVVTGQLQTALNSWAVIEQAKGLVAQQLGVDMTGASAALRGFADARDLKLSDVAREVIAGDIETQDLSGDGARSR
jgi:transcriptional regulator with GAF, ATPase, and Fis domain